MSNEKNEFCPGEILYASSYGGVEDYTFTNSIAVTSTWLEAVKERTAVVCETNNTFWIDFELKSEMILDGEQDSNGVNPYLLFARRYCYRKFCETYCGYFGMTEVFGYIYRIFSHRHKERPDEYDLAYAEFVDSILEDVRFIVCIRRPNTLPEDKDKTEVSQSNDDTSTQEMFTTNSAKTIVQDTGRNKKPTSLFSINDDYFEDDLLEMELDNVYDETPPGSPSPVPQMAMSTPKKYSSKRALSDYFVDSPMAAEMAPETSLQDEADANVTEMASMGLDSTILQTSTSAGPDHFDFTDESFTDIQNKNDQDDKFKCMPIAILYDPKTDSENVLGYEPERVKKQYHRSQENTFVIAGLFDEPANRISHNEAIIEITYAVRPTGRVLTLTAIDVYNNYLEMTGHRGWVRFELNEFIRAIRSFDSNARLLNPTQFDMLSFNLDHIHPESFFKRTRKVYLRFVKYH